MLAQPMSMVLPEVIGYRLTGNLPQLVTATDLVLTITKVILALSYILIDRDFRCFCHYQMVQ